MRARVPVLLTVALDQTYDYLVPDGLELEPGCFVLVPFGPQSRIGVVWDTPVGEPGKPVDPKKLKTIAARLDVPPLPPISLRFAEWIARYTLAPLGMVVRMMMSARTAFEPVKPRFGVTLVADASEPPRMTPARRRALDVAADGAIRAKSALAAEAQCSTGVVDGLVASGNLVEVAIPEKRVPQPDPKHRATEFTPEQAQAVHALQSAVDGGNFSVSLLDGVTGSGKTEVYFEAVARTLERGQQALIMLPEIALTDQFMRRFQAPLRLRAGRMAFGARRARSAGASGARWRRARRASSSARGRRCSCPSASSASSSSTRSTTPASSRTTACTTRRATWRWCAAASAASRSSLASATPSIESHVNARTGRYRHVILPGRFSGTALPDVTPIDLRTNPPEKGKWLSPPLIEAVTQTLAAKQQTLLFLNRRGYAPLTLCRTCGHRIECPQCTAWLVEHRFRGRLHCHHCGFSIPLPEKCPKCSEPGSLVACGPGVERVAEEVTERFPEARLALLSSDLIPGLTEMREMIREIEAGGIDIIIGTQIVAKGHHFPNLATVGIVDGDLGLAQGADPRAGERTFQLLLSGDGPRRAHLRARPRLRADAHARAPGDGGDHLRRPRGLHRARDRRAPARAAAAVRAARRAHRVGARQGGGAARRPRHRAPGAAGRAHRGAGAGGGAARRDPRALSLAAPGQGAARDRHAGLLARLARRAAAPEGRPAPHRRHRPV